MPDPLRVINRTSQPNRYALTARAFGKIGRVTVPYTAVEGDEGIAQCEARLGVKLMPMSGQGDLSPGQRGCALSHFKLLSEAFEEQQDEVLEVAEDDARPRARAYVEVARLQAAHPDWQFIALGSTVPHTDPESEISFHQTTQFFCTHHYMVRRSLGLEILRLARKNGYWIADDPRRFGDFAPHVYAITCRDELEAYHRTGHAMTIQACLPLSASAIYLMGDCDLD